MADSIQTKILSHIKSNEYHPQKPRKLAKQLNLAQEENYPAFREALRNLMHSGRVIIGASGAVLVPGEHLPRNELIGTYRHNKRGFGFVVPSDPDSHEDLFIPPGENNAALSGDVVRARITNRDQREGKTIISGRIIEIITRKQQRFVGTLQKTRGQWMVYPDGNVLTEPVLTPDAASRHVKPGAKVVFELTQYPDIDTPGQGVITDILGQAGEKDVDLKSIIIQYGLPEQFPEDVRSQARHALDNFKPETERERRVDLTGEVICTIDPPDAKDYDDAISLHRLPDGDWELGVHIADVSFFVPPGSPLDEEAKARGNSTYFPGHVIPMLPEILSNGVCSLQEAVPRLCKSAFIVLDKDAKPTRTRFANTIIKSRQRLRYIEAQAIIDREDHIPHPDGPKRLSDYEPAVVKLLDDMNVLAKRIQRRRLEAGQLVLNLPEVDLVLDEEGKVVDAVPEDTSFTHTLIEMFMVEANEAVARLFHALDVPFIRRVHPEPEFDNTERLRQFVHVAGYKLSKEIDRKSLQRLLDTVSDKPEGFAINLAVLRSLTRAEYSPEPLGHYALASEHYCHFTSPIRRYADLTVHRLLDAYFEAVGHYESPPRRKKVTLDDVPSFEGLVEVGRHISFTERRSEDAERELRQVKVLELLESHIGDVFDAVVTGITNFGIFVQIRTYLIDGLIRYQELMDDWWDVDERSGVVRGQRTGVRIGIGDQCKVAVMRVDSARRELDLQITELKSRKRKPDGEQHDRHGGGGGGGGGDRPHKAKKRLASKGKWRGGSGGGGHKANKRKGRPGGGRRR
jgi:ribonuclease R